MLGPENLTRLTAHVSSSLGLGGWLHVLMWRVAPYRFYGGLYNGFRRRQVNQDVLYLSGLAYEFAGIFRANRWAYYPEYS